MQFIFKDGNQNLFHISDLTTKYFEEFDKLKYNYESDYLAYGKNSFRKVSSNRTAMQKQKISYQIPTQTDYDFDFILNAINGFFNPLNEPFYLIDIDNKKETKIDYIGISENYSHPERKQLTRFELEFAFLENFWKSLYKNTYSFTAIATGDSISIPISKNNQYAPFKISITNTSSNTNDNFFISLVNGIINRYIVIAETNFVQNKTIEIDSSYEDGLVKLLPDDQSIKRSVTAGSPFELYPGVNTINYSTLTSSIVDINIEFYERYLI